MTSTTATVETLTAEVRVLMVGNRQVTISVYNQLDWAPWWELGGPAPDDYQCFDGDGGEIFGRVCPRDQGRNELFLVGRQRGTGALVRAHVVDPVHPDYARRLPDYFPKDGRSKRDWCWHQEYTMILNEHSRWEWDNAWARVRYAEMQGLPLIVLAGLR